MKNQLAIPIVLLFGLLLMSLISLRGEILALTIPLIAYLGAAIWSAPEKVDLTIRRRVSSEWVSAGMPVQVQMTVRNTGALVEEVLLTDPLPPGVELVEGKNVVFASLLPGGELDLEYTIRAPRGEYSVAYTIGTALETFGLFGREFHLAAPMNLRIKPSTLTVKSIPIRPPQTRGSSGPIPSRQGGAGVEFFTVREYQPGDPRRLINWRIAARHPHELYANVHQTERIADVGLILDARSHVNAQIDSDSLFEHSVRAAAALAEAFLGDGNRVGLIVYGGTIRRVFPGYGKVQRERILRELARAEVGHNFALEHLEYLPTRFLPTRSQVVLISPLTMADIPVLVRLRARGYAVMAVCPDPLDFEVRSPHQAEPKTGDLAAEYAYRIARVERCFVLEKVRRAGVQVVDWRVDKPLEPALQEAIRRQPLQRHWGGRL